MLFKVTRGLQIHCAEYASLASLVSATWFGRSTEYRTV